MRVATLVILLAAFIPPTAHSQVTVLNEVNFGHHQTYDNQEPYELVTFKVTVINNSKKKIPDLGVTNRSEHLQFFVNGKLDNPISLYNGLEAIEGEKVIRPGEQATYQISWQMGEDSGIYMKGDVIEVHWKYMSYLSKVVIVDLRNKEVKSASKK